MTNIKKIRKRKKSTFHSYNLNYTEKQAMKQLNYSTIKKKSEMIIRRNQLCMSRPTRHEQNIPKFSTTIKTANINQTSHQWERSKAWDRPPRNTEEEDRSDEGRDGDAAAIAERGRRSSTLFRRRRSTRNGAAGGGWN